MAVKTFLCPASVKVNPARKNPPSAMFECREVEDEEVEETSGQNYTRTPALICRIAFVKIVANKQVYSRVYT